MHIEAIQGDIVDWAPEHVEMAAVWLRSGFNLRDASWGRILDHYPFLNARNPGVDLQRPWESPEDQLIDLPASPETLRCLYVFSNQPDAKGYPDFDDVSQAVRRCLDVAQRENIQSVAMIHIPVAPIGGMATAESNDQSGSIMRDSIRQWDQEHPESSVNTVYLVDLRNGFRHLFEE